MHSMAVKPGFESSQINTGTHTPNHITKHPSKGLTGDEPGEVGWNQTVVRGRGIVES